jgi:hypothetical protein
MVVQPGVSLLWELHLNTHVVHKVFAAEPAL